MFPADASVSSCEALVLAVRSRNIASALGPLLGVSSSLLLESSSSAVVAGLGASGGFARRFRGSSAQTRLVTDKDGTWPGPVDDTAVPFWQPRVGGIGSFDRPVAAHPRSSK